MRQLNEILFASKEQREFFGEMLEKSKSLDCYHQSFFYCMGICEDTRRNINRLFDFVYDQIRPEGLRDSWQTSGSVRVTRLAFNLWNGYIEKGKSRMFTPYELFDCGYAPYFYEAIRLRYPEYCRKNEERFSCNTRTKGINSMER